MKTTHIDEEMMSKEARLTDAEAKQLKQLVQAECLAEDALMRKWILEGLECMRVRYACTLYEQGSRCSPLLSLRTSRVANLTYTLKSFIHARVQESRVANPTYTLKSFIHARVQESRVANPTYLLKSFLHTWVQESRVANPTYEDGGCGIWWMVGGMT